MNYIMSVPGHSNDNNNVNVQTSTATTTVVVMDADNASAKNSLFGKLLSRDTEQGEFVDQDRHLAQQRFGDVFFHDSVSEDIYDAIACKGGTTNNPKRMKASIFKLKLSIIVCLSLL